MATIDKLDLSVYVQYAQRTQYVEQIRQEYRLDQAETIPPQLMVVDFTPKPSEMDLLLGVITVTTPWAMFLPPKRWRERRRSPFAVASVAPSLGTSEEQMELADEIEQVQTSSAEEAREKKVLMNCFQQLHRLNDWLGHVVGRIGQFLQA